MRKLSTNQAANKLGIATKSLSRYVAQGKIPAPEIIEVGGGTIHAWTEEEIEAVRKLLPKIANGRKTRYKKRSAIIRQHSAKSKAQPRAAVPDKSRKPKKK